MPSRKSGRADRAVAGIAERPGPTNAESVAAAAPILELPPVSALTVVDGGRTQAETELAAAEALLDGHRFVEAADALRSLWDDVRHDPVLALRQRVALAWADLYLGDLDAAEDSLAHADAIVQSPRFDAADRADVLFRRGCVALKQGDRAEAVALFTRALDTNARAPLPGSGLAARAHEWRSRIHVAQRDLDAAQRDVERALELAGGDREAQANALFQASIVAERRKQWLLARCHAEQALELYRQLGKTLSAARVLNNLGGIQFLLGDAIAAEQSLLAALEHADAAQSDADLAQAVNSLAQVYLRTGRPLEARARALRAVELLEGRTDFLDELGNAQLVVAGSHQMDGELDAAAGWLDRAEATCMRLGSAGHLAAVWVARGDLAREQGDVDGAADLYRRAAETLQDVHF
jgi:tetratricopeptide (TPR) repeat protein